MRKLFVTILLLSVPFAVTASETDPSEGVSRYVNPFIGTSNYGVTQPGPMVPAGMVSMSPFNTIPSPDHKIHTDNWCSTPYVYQNKWVIGFTQVNLSGVGCPDFGSLLLMPTIGNLEVDYNVYKRQMSDVVAKAGYFSAKVGQVKAEMTATKRTTLSRYTFDAGQGNVLFNIGKGLSNESGCFAKIVSNTEVEGMRLMGDFCYGMPQSVVPIYFVIRTNKPATSVRYWKKQPELPGAVAQWSSYSGQYKVYENYKREIAGDEIGVAFSYNCAQGEQVDVSVGISYVSIGNARENLDQEQGEANFEQIYASAVKNWNEVLSVVQLEGGSEDQKVQFYTALYHNWVHPNVFNDVNGEYVKMNSNEIGKVKHGQERFTMFSGWDVYRISPFLGALFFPQRQNDVARSLMDMYNESGNLPKFEIASKEFNVMQGDPALPYLASCYMLGVAKGIDVEDMYQAMLKNALGETSIRKGSEFYMQNHYLPLMQQYDNSVAQALEFYVADYSLAQIAKSLGKTDDYDMLIDRAMGYKKYFDSNYGLLRPVMPDGKFMEGFNPLEGENFAPVNGFHEGTSWNYSFAIPYDVKGLIKMFGSATRFVDSLQSCFINKRFDMGNEPDMGYPYLFSYVKGKEYLTQYWVNDCLNKYFSNTPGGLPGNDDAGTMSAWQNLSMMGIYPLCPAVAQYVITTPTFDKITIKLNEKYYAKSELIIEAKNRTKDNIYIDRIELGGKPYRSYMISHKELTDAGRLTIYCTSTPRK